LPYDADTSACWFAGPRLEGERCSTTTAESSCEAGLYCSPIDSLCYALCDPSAVDTCTAPDRCVTVQDSAQDPWFGLCL
jgi:hypothetical protein